MRPRQTPVLGIALILSGGGGALFVLSVKLAAVDRSWAEASVVFIGGIVASLVAFNFYVFYANFSEGRIRALLEQRDESLRRVDELRTYANVCELEAKCWPEDSSDRAELLAYAGVARRQADETLRRWREIERALRTARFERVTSSASDARVDRRSTKLALKLAEVPRRALVLAASVLIGAILVGYLLTSGLLTIPRFTTEGPVVRNGVAVIVACGKKRGLEQMGAAMDYAPEPRTGGWWPEHSEASDCTVWYHHPPGLEQRQNRHERAQEARLDFP